MADWTDYLSDPMMWLAALGTGGGLYGAWKANKGQENYNRQVDQARQQYANDVASWRASDAAWRNQMMGSVGDIMSQAMASMSGGIGPINIDVDKFYRGASDKAQKAARRGVLGNLALRGAESGGYADNAVAEAMLADDAIRRKEAENLGLGEAQINANLAAQNRQASMSIWPAILSAAMGRFGNAPGMPPMPIMPVAPTYTPYGSFDSMGKYIAGRRQDDAAKARLESEARFREWVMSNMRNSGSSGWGYNPVPQTSTEPFYPYGPGENF